MISNGELCPNYFSVNVSVLAVVFRRQISKNRQFCLKLSPILTLVDTWKQPLRAVLVKRCFWNLGIIYVKYLFIKVYFSKVAGSYFKKFTGLSYTFKIVNSITFSFKGLYLSFKQFLISSLFRTPFNGGFCDFKKSFQ